MYVRPYFLIRASAWSTVRIPKWTQGALCDTVGEHELVAAQQDRFGEENVVAANLHMDEGTPHVHMVIVPCVMDNN